MQVASTILKITGLEIGYTAGRQSNVVLSDINLSLKKGSLVCFMGPNGVGKSTLLRTLSKIHPPLKGAIHIHDKSLTDFSSQELATTISLVLTDPISTVNLSVYDLVSFGRYPHTNAFARYSKQDLDKIDEAIDLTGLHDISDRKLYEISDGQLQKTLIARALAQDGDLMILDEPNTHLDLNNRIEIMSLLRKLAHETDKSILMATHELDLALQTADRIWLAGNGVIQEGVAEDLILTGDFDKIFTMKGFDLKTGRINLIRNHNKSISLTGEGFAFLWTKNALEREGFRIEDNQDHTIAVSIDDQNKVQLNLITPESEFQFDNLEKLLDQLKIME